MVVAALDEAWDKCSVVCPPCEPQKPPRSLSLSLSLCVCVCVCVCVCGFVWLCVRARDL